MPRASSAPVPRSCLWAKCQRSLLHSCANIWKVFEFDLDGIRSNTNISSRTIRPERPRANVGAEPQVTVGGSESFDGHVFGAELLAVGAPSNRFAGRRNRRATMARLLESQSKPGTKMACPEPCTGLRRPQLFMVGIVPYYPGFDCGSFGMGSQAPEWPASWPWSVSAERPSSFCWGLWSGDSWVGLDWSTAPPSARFGKAG